MDLNLSPQDLAFRDEVREFLAPIIAERKLNPGTDLISQLLLAEYEGEPLPDDDVADHHLCTSFSQGAR